MKTAHSLTRIEPPETVGQEAQLILYWTDTILEWRTHGQTWRVGAVADNKPPPNQSIHSVERLYCKVSVDLNLTLSLYLVMFVMLLKRQKQSIFQFMRLWVLNTKNYLKIHLKKIHVSSKEIPLMLPQLVKNSSNSNVKCLWVPRMHCMASWINYAFTVRSLFHCLLTFDVLSLLLVICCGVKSSFYICWHYSWVLFVKCWGMSNFLKSFLDILALWDDGSLLHTLNVLLKTIQLTKALCWLKMCLTRKMYLPQWLFCWLNVNAAFSKCTNSNWQKK